jgi:hypothetical protein
MEKDIGKVPKNPDTDIIVRIDDFGGRVGITIREFVKSERYTGFTKAGTRISADNFPAFKALINAIDEEELAKMAASVSVTTTATGIQSNLGEKSAEKPAEKQTKKAAQKPTTKEEVEF